ncbi:MAG: VOC family protein, partial [Terriglobales bacterium]
EIKLLFLEFQSAGVAFHQTLKKQPWGAKNFVVKDPDGNLLLFAGPANEQLPSRSVLIEHV